MMKNKLPKLIASDLDGTLFLNDHVTVSQYTMEVINRMIDMGVEFVSITGRCFDIIPLAEIPRSRYIVSSNGSYIYDVKTGKPLRTTYIPKDHLKIAWEIMRERIYRHDCLLELFEDNKLVIERSTLKNLDKIMKRCAKFHYDFISEGRAKVVESFDEYILNEGDRVIKINMPGRSIEACPELSAEIEKTGFFSMTTDGFNLEATDPLVNKGEALNFICEKIGATAQECVAFGDGSNDIEMLMTAGMGVAMGNSKEDIKAAAKFVTDTNSNDGLAKFLYNNFLI